MAPRSQGIHKITGQVAATLRRANAAATGAVPVKDADGEMRVPLPNCRKCRRPLRKNGHYFSKNSHNRHYYHVACWKKISLANEDDEGDGDIAP